MPLCAGVFAFLLHKHPKINSGNTFAVLSLKRNGIGSIFRSLLEMSCSSDAAYLQQGKIKIACDVKSSVKTECVYVCRSVV